MHYLFHSHQVYKRPFETLIPSLIVWSPFIRKSLLNIKPIYQFSFVRFSIYITSYLQMFISQALAYFVSTMTCSLGRDGFAKLLKIINQKSRDLARYRGPWVRFKYPAILGWRFTKKAPKCVISTQSHQSIRSNFVNPNLTQLAYLI